MKRKDSLSAGLGTVGLISLLIFSLTASCKHTARSEQVSSAAPGGSCGPFGDAPAQLIGSKKPWCLGGALLGPWADADGTARYACVYRPSTIPPDVRLPLVVYLHPSLFSAGSVRATNLLHYLNSAELSDRSAARGFIMLAPQGRNTVHYYPFPDNKGYGWDNWYRQLDPSGSVKVGNTIYHENVDAEAIDHFIAWEIGADAIDVNRIYLTGWSNGAAMAYLYALNRPNIAALAAYSAPNPFDALADPCPQTPVVSSPADNTQLRVSNPGLPSMHIHNSCDTAGICANGELLARQLKALGSGQEDVIINSLMMRTDSCLDACGDDVNGNPSLLTNPLGLANHLRWPYTWTATMLEFFRAHALKGAGVRANSRP